MTASIEDRILAGRNHALSQLDMIAACSGDEGARAHAAGMVAGCRNFILSRWGARETFMLFANLADDVIAPEIACGERDILDAAKRGGQA